VSKLYRYLATSGDRPARLARKLYYGLDTFTFPAPKIIVKPMLWTFLAVRSVYYWVMRVFICDPLFKAYCKQYGRGVHSGAHIHWIQGQGDIILGDYVIVDGKCDFGFSARYCETPVLKIGDYTKIGPGCSFSVGRRITIGQHCMIAGGTSMFDSNGHPTDPEARLAGLPPAPEEVRSIEIGDNVWIGGGSVIFPGVKVGEGSIVSARSVVRSNVHAYTIVAGNPARKIADLTRPARCGPHADGPTPADEGTNTQIPTSASFHQLATGENR
jgi:acetyltransferase-like isoleucine patch superfamily enzyme